MREYIKKVCLKIATLSETAAKNTHSEYYHDYMEKWLILPYADELSPSAGFKVRFLSRLVRLFSKAAQSVHESDNTVWVEGNEKYEYQAEQGKKATNSRSNMSSGYGAFTRK